ncbi:uncharacterized protein ACA1_290210 [Acanthamoeba castellanii str. Neff]|uniref:UBP34/UBP24/USP9X/USP9Y-like ARM repeat region domain-containing protein n=1 Tax=Acanthamoeba castellanii (strain ATCC 30010 / Neff) TaxID=1257118 RepID=L8HJ62_ACACF|nr:uncharacterized protein ACA1_290210 [Acanthamoeba castellanii str. Neff]ELR25257.1 hypothetical protein ACA1_290210 [Acanthamoeba castellanii str. Neff]
MREFLIPSLQKAFLPQLEVIFTIMLGLGDEELRTVKKEDVEEIVRHFEAILKEYAYTETWEKSERFCLAFALKCFRSTNLEKRLHGLSYIEEAISMTQRRKYQQWDDGMSYTGYTNPTYRAPQVARWMDSKYLLAWIQENQIIERLFQSKLSDMHPELIKRSKNLLKFMASEKFLNQGHLDMMWKATATQHAEPAVYEVLGAISSNLSPEHQNYLLQLIHSIPFAEYSPRTINLIAQFQNTYSSYPSSTEIKLRTMNLLWQIVQDDSKVEQSIADAALSQLCKVVSAYNLRIHRNMLIQIFCDHIRNRVSVHQSIVLLQKVLQEHYHDDKEMRTIKGTDNSRQKVVNELKSEVGLVDLLFRELALYKQACVRRRAEILSTAAETGDERLADVDWNTAVLEGRYPHLKQVSTRLDFIRFVFDYSIARLTKDRADIMWESLVLNSMSREEVETTLGWFYRICSSFSKQNSNTITGVMVDNFFEHRLGKLDVASLSGMGFDCFRRYFCCLNSQHRSLRMEGPIDDFLVLQFDGLLGLDQLWNVALGSSVEVVFKESMTLLVALYQKVDDTRQFNAVRKSFVDRCMERLQLAHQQITLGENVPNAQNQIDRLIFMLKNFLQESKLRDEKKKKEGGAAPAAVGPMPKLEPVVAAPPPKNVPQVRKGKEQDVAFLQEMIPGLSTVAAVLAMEKNYYNMDLALSALMEDSTKDKLMAEAAKFETEAAQAEEVEAQMAAAVEAVEEIPPSKFLFDNQAYFDLLFELLNHDNIDRDRVWEILMELPTNPIIEQTLKTLRSPNWDELINSRSLYKMLYCLQIIDRLMSYGEKDTEAQTKEKYEWCKLFFYCDGFHHILNLVLHDDFLTRNQSSRAFKSCLQLLLKIIHFFIQGMSSTT